MKEKAVLYPFNKITQGILRNKEFISKYEFTSVIDFAFNKGCNTGLEIENEKNDIFVDDDYQTRLEDIDTLLLNDGVIPFPATEKLIDEYTKNKVVERWKNMILYAKNKKIKIIIVAGITDLEIVKWLKENEVKIFKSYVSNKTIKSKIEEYSNFFPETPEICKVAIYGTRGCIGKFTTQMNLYKYLIKNNKKTRLLITEPTGFLFNQPQLEHLECNHYETYEYINALIKESQVEKTDIVIMAEQGGINDIYKKDLNFSFNFITRLKAFVPNKVILISDYDDINNIKESLNTIKTITGIEDCIILLPNRVEIEYGLYQKKYYDEFVSIKNKIRNEIGNLKVELISNIENIVNDLI